MDCINSRVLVGCTYSRSLARSYVGRVYFHEAAGMRIDAKFCDKQIHSFLVQLVFLQIDRHVHVSFCTIISTMKIIHEASRLWNLLVPDGIVLELSMLVVMSI